MYLSIIVPIFNEKKTIKNLVEKILNQTSFKKQLIIVDDFSTDGSIEIIKELKKNNKIDLAIFHEKNLGKGAAIKTAQKFVHGDVVIIQDADLEYDPVDYKIVTEKIFSGENEVVYGSRVLGAEIFGKTQVGFTSKFRIFANFVLTLFTNILFFQKLTDAHTCYKAFDTKVFKQLELRENDFAFCPEVTALVSKRGIKILEVPIRYSGRSYKEGKKISFKDGVRAILVLLKYRLFY